jgi:hypothetical protein
MSLLTNILPLRVTALLTTPLCPSRLGVTGKPSALSRVFLSVPSSLSLPEMCNWLAAQLILSLLERNPPVMPSILRIVGGDLEFGLAIVPELPLLDAFLFLPERNLAR